MDLSYPLGSKRFRYEILDLGESLIIQQQHRFCFRWICLIYCLFQFRYDIEDCFGLDANLCWEFYLRVSFYEAAGKCRGEIWVDEVGIRECLPPQFADWPAAIGG